MNLQTTVGGCYGSDDGLFAEHPADEKHAKQWMKEAFAQGISWNAVEQIHEGYMNGKEYLPEHINEQMQRVRSFKKYFK